MEYNDGREEISQKLNTGAARKEMSVSNGVVGAGARSTVASAGSNRIAESSDVERLRHENGDMSES